MFWVSVKTSKIILSLKVELLVSSLWVNAVKDDAGDPENEGLGAGENEEDENCRSRLFIPVFDIVDGTSSCYQCRNAPVADRVAWEQNDKSNPSVRLPESHVGHPKV